MTDTLAEKTILAYLEQHACTNPGQVAVTAPGRAALSYGRLYHHLQETIAALNRLGLGRNDPVAIVLPNGPEMAVAFLAVASASTSAPLNPNYRAAEFDFYLSDLGAKALLFMAGVDSPARAVAGARHIPVIELTPLPGPAGLFRLQAEPGRPANTPERARPDDIALILHTSGTTSRPKMVPLSQANLYHSAANIQATLQLTPADRCLNIMPLFHIHGLIAGVLASLAARASVICTPGYDASQFFAWMDECQPTWYTAVPTMHQAILSRAELNRHILATSQLRFVRSSSAALPPQVLLDLERTFNAPVIEAYGMTEAAHQMASNPLPPSSRKVGSVGPAAGPAVAIMAEDSPELRPAGVRGEIVIRGPNVTGGYASNPEANSRAFSNGWFRTGDEGWLDEDGYLYLSGRLKEIINRGGEKIAPREVDEALLAHPAVAQAVAFAMPDNQLGEDVAAAVVLRPGLAADELDLRRFVAQRLADFKVPRKILIVDEIPKGPTGKLQRIGLAAQLGVAADEPELTAVEFVAPRSELEMLLAEIWQEVLNLERVGVYDRFLDLGGDSILATRLVARLRQLLDLELTLLDFFEAPTIDQQAAVVERMLLDTVG